MTCKILGLGNPLWDRSMDVSEQFIPDHGLTKGAASWGDGIEHLNACWKEASEGKNPSVGSIGGSGANVIKTLARLGYRTALCGKIGSDKRGTMVQQRLEAIGIQSLLTQSTLPHGVVNCFITPDGERTMQGHLGACSELSDEDIIKENFSQAKHLHVEGYAVLYQNVLAKSITLAKENKATISIDLASKSIIEHYRDKLTDGVKQADFVFGNFEEVAAYTGMRSIDEAMKKFDIAQTVIVTNGSKGCWIKEKQQATAVLYPVPHVVKVIDTTGAGDFFQAGFLHSALQGKKTEVCVQTAHAAAAAVIQEIGAELPPAKWEELKETISLITK